MIANNTGEANGSDQYAENEDTDNVEVLFDNIMKEAEYGEQEEVPYLSNVL